MSRSRLKTVFLDLLILRWSKRGHRSERVTEEMWEMLMLWCLVLKALVVEVDRFVSCGAASADARRGTMITHHTCTLLLDQDGHVD